MIEIGVQGAAYNETLMRKAVICRFDPDKMIKIRLA